MSWSNLLPLPISSLPISSSWTTYFSLQTSCASLYFMKNSPRPPRNACMCMGVAYLLEHYRCILEGNWVSLPQQVPVANGWRLWDEPHEPLPCTRWKCFATAFEYDHVHKPILVLFYVIWFSKYSHLVLRLIIQIWLKCPLKKHRGVSFKHPASQFGNHCAMWQISPQTNTLII